MEWVIIGMKIGLGIFIFWIIVSFLIGVFSD